MNRNKLKELLAWKESIDRKPLILRGARQVGKTWIMNEFGRLYYKNVAYINFDDNERMKNLFLGQFDLEKIIQGLKIESKINIEKENTLIIFDEIQENSGAMKALKYFNEKANEYHIISAGSLLGVSIHRGISFPVGKVDFMELGPLTFEEFLSAISQEDLEDLLKNENLDLLNIYHEKIIEYLKLYYYIGGMPEVVNSYVINKDLIKVRNIQKKLLLSYENDFSKYASTSIVPRIKSLWDNIPTQLAKENRKFIYGLIKTGARAREYEMALSWLIDAGLVYQINRVNTNKIPISAYQDFNSFKLYILDVRVIMCKS